MSSWEAITDKSHLDSISVTVVDAVRHSDQKLDWRLTVEDKSGKQFEVEVWNKHDHQTEWVEGAQYELRAAFGQTWDDGRQKKLHSSRTWSVDRIDNRTDCRLMVVGDTHVGRREHPSKPSKSIDCAGKFEQAIEIAVDTDVDSILHTGDVFHDHVTEDDCATVDAAFETMRYAGIEFYYILGNHECDPGTRLLQKWEKRGVATHLDMDGSNVADTVTVYGHDHQSSSEFSVEKMNCPYRLVSPVSILVLHQTLAPFHAGADVDLDEINDEPSGSFDYVVSGHLHDPEQLDWHPGEFVYAGSIEDLSTNKNASDPSVWFLSVDGETVETHRRRL
jgi:predicted phosphodiesterase